MKIDVPVTDESFLEMVKEQLAKVSAEYGHKYNSTNEFYGVLHEEVHEILHAVQEGKGFVTSELLGKMIKACSTIIRGSRSYMQND